MTAAPGAPRAKKNHLGPILDGLIAKARRTAHDQAVDLAKGLRIAVRVKDGYVTATFSRRAVDVGISEEATVLRECSIPWHAERIPKTGQKRRPLYRPGIVGPEQHYFAYRWRDTEDAHAMA